MELQRTLIEHCRCNLGHEFTVERTGGVVDGSLPACPACGSELVHAFRVEQVPPQVTELENDDD